MKNSAGGGFRGASISISEKSLASKNEIRAYQTLLWQQNPIELLSQFNLRTLTFDQPSEEAFDEFGNLEPGPYTFRNPIIKGKDCLNNIDVGDGFNHSSSTSVTNIDVSKRNLVKATLTDSDGEFKKAFPFNTFNLTSLQGNLGYARNLHDFKIATSKEHFNEPFTYGYEGCCWQTSLQNDLTELESDSPTNEQADVSFEFKMIAKVFDVKNVAPRIVLPSMWYVNIGCSSSLELRPFDQDDDVIKCRWADETEAGFAAFNPLYHPFINLVSESCQLEFDAEKFQKFYEDSDGSKPEVTIPIAIMIEDFDQTGFKRSSMPIQFLLGTMLSSDIDVPQTDGGVNNGEDAEASETIEPTEMVNCDLIPVLSSIKDLVSHTDQESKIIRSFDIHEGGRNGNHLYS